MSKLIVSLVAATLLMPAPNPGREKFKMYKAVEAYEIRPGILMMPRYSADGQVCEIGLEKLPYSPGINGLVSSLSRQEIDQIFDELVPNAERGPKPTGILEHGMTVFSPQDMVTDEEYRDVTIRIYISASPFGRSGIKAEDVAATLKWKNRKCQ